MTITEAILWYRELKDDNQVLRREQWKHGRYLVPMVHDLYMATVGDYPLVPIPVQLTTDELVADDWTIVTRDSLVFAEKQELKREERIRTGRRILVNAS